MLRFYCMGRYQKQFTDLGVPTTYYPKTYTWTPDSNLKDNQKKATKAVKEFLTGKSNKIIKGRFILMKGYNTNTGGAGQNDMIFGGRIEAGPGIKVKKVSKNTGSPLKGAHFDLYQYKNSAWVKIDSGVTNSNGEINFRKNLKEGKKYKVIETQAPAGYELPSPRPEKTCNSLPGASESPWSPKFEDSLEPTGRRITIKSRFS